MIVVRHAKCRVDHETATRGLWVATVEFSDLGIVIMLTCGCYLTVPRE